MPLVEKEKHIVIIGDIPCRTPAEMLQSTVFRHVLERFVAKLQRHDSPLLAALQAFQVAGEDDATKIAGGDTAAGAAGETVARFNLAGLTELLRLLVSNSPAEIKASVPGHAPALADPTLLYKFVEELYNFWRKQERFLIYERGPSLLGEEPARHKSFVKANESLKSLVLETYRSICANLIGRRFRIYRQLPCGAGAGLLMERIDWDAPAGYTQLLEIPFIQLAVIDPPLVYYPRRNYRKGLFEPIQDNPLLKARLNTREWACYPAKVGDLLLFIYFHHSYLSLGTSLSNLFELADATEIRAHRPDGIMVFGVEPEFLDQNQTVYFEDEANGVVVGVIGRSEDVDYFGYFKKMALTLHNVIMIERGFLPIHGAMARIVLKSGRSANVILMGDSGAGKSESLEAFRVLADEYIRQLTVIFDDMGSLRKTRDGRIVAMGTEIGAFVRLDDLEPGFAYTEIDRSIFMNPHRTNARLVIPLTPYQEVVAGYPVDIFLYANNYEQVDETHPHIELYSDESTAFQVFSQGARVSKGTTDEQGLVHTYFANPFGAPQKREKHDPLAKAYLRSMLATGVKVGQLRTRLGIAGYELGGPESAARALFEFITRG